MPEILSPNATTSVKTVDDINDIFKSLDSDEPEVKEEKNVVKEERKEKEEEEEESEEKDEGDIKLVDEEDEDTEKLDLSDKNDNIDIIAPPRKKEILAKYPDLFKTFPFLEKVMYRDKQYTELFGSFDDAKELAEKSEIYNEFDTQLLNGKTEDILKNVKESDPKAFDKIVDNYLQSLAKVDKDAYYEVTNNVIRQLIVEMAKEAKTSNNEELQQAALLVNQFIFNTSEFKPSKPRVDSKSEEINEAEKERLEYQRERFETASSELQTKVDNVLKSTISEYIDPKGVMSAYVKKNAIADALRYLNSTVSNDIPLRKNLDKLWRGAFDAKFSKDALGKIQAAYLGRAKSILPLAIKNARFEALKDIAPKAKVEVEDKEEQTPRRGHTTTGRPATTKSANGMKRGETISEFFARE